MSLILIFLAVALQAFGQSVIEPQPYCHSVSGRFKASPNYWLHATPVLRSHWWFDDVPLVRRQYTDYWTSWKNISYLFALYVIPQEVAILRTNFLTAVTLIPAQASISQGNNQVIAIPWVIPRTLGLPPAMAPITLTF